MNVQLFVTKSDYSLPNLQKEFKHLGLNYEVKYAEEHPEMVSHYHVRHSPNIIIDGALAFTRQPSAQELKAYFDRLSSVSSPAH